MRQAISHTVQTSFHNVIGEVWPPLYSATAAPPTWAYAIVSHGGSLPHYQYSAANNMFARIFVGTGKLDGFGIAQNIPQRLNVAIFDIGDLGWGASGSNLLVLR